MKIAFWARRAHKWIALVVGIQALFWLIGGLYMTIVPLKIIHGDHLVGRAAGRLSARAAPRVSLARLATRFPGMTGFSLKPLMQREVYVVERLGHPALVDARSGETLSPLDEGLARQLATRIYQGDATIEKMTWITRAPQEVRGSPVPMWRVQFADDGQTTLYLSPFTGEMLSVRHDLWRWFDFVWMFHIMDYEDRSHVNNVLLQTATVAGLLFALSGVWLLLYSFSGRKQS